MGKLLKRFLAYTIDLMVVMIIVQSLSSVEFINRQLPKYNKYSNQYVELMTDYSNFKLDLNKNFEDKEISEEEYNKLIEKHDSYKDILVTYYEDSKITEKEYTKLNKKIDKMYQDDYKEIAYKMDKNSIICFIIYLVVVFLYFGGFNKITNGQTLGKKLTRLRIVNNKDKNQNISIFKYFIRAFLLYQPISYLARLIGVLLCGQGSYYTLISVIGDIQYYVEVVILLMIMVRVDGRGLHDILAGTRVILLDRFGEEVEDGRSLAKKKLEEKQESID